MKTVWTKGLNVQEKEEISAGYTACANIRKRLTALLNDKIIVKRKDVVSIDKYDSPGWAYLQADAVGYERALNEVISLILNSPVTKESD